MTPDEAHMDSPKLLEQGQQWWCSQPFPEHNWCCWRQQAWASWHHRLFQSVPCQHGQNCMMINQASQSVPGSTLKLEVESKGNWVRWIVTIQIRNLSHVNISINALFMLAEVLLSLNCGIHPVLCFSQNKQLTFWADIPWYNVLLPCSDHAGNGYTIAMSTDNEIKPLPWLWGSVPTCFPSWRCVPHGDRLSQPAWGCCLHRCCCHGTEHPNIPWLVKTHDKSCQCLCGRAYNPFWYLPS